jgi:prevent-host-death family protein
MIDLNDIHSLSDFQRNAKDHIERLKKTGKPQVLTVNGKAEVIVQDAQSYQALIETIERLETLAGLRRGLEEVEQGKTASAQDVFTRMRTKHKIPKRA